jgi:hypothetical protein
MSDLIRMNPEIKTKWVAALRSGTYEQGSHVLRKGDRYCCLGVLCEILKMPSHLNTATGNYSYAGHNVTGLPIDMRVQIGLSAGNHSEAMVMNDTRGYTFLQIADYIERDF